jgi:hypothetical protein
MLFEVEPFSRPLQKLPKNHGDKRVAIAEFTFLCGIG